MRLPPAGWTSSSRSQPALVRRARESPVGTMSPIPAPSAGPSPPTGRLHRPRVLDRRRAFDRSPGRSVEDGGRPDDDAARHRPASRSRATADRRAPGAPARRPAGPGRASRRCDAAAGSASHRSRAGVGPRRRPATQPGSDSMSSSAARVRQARFEGGCHLVAVERDRALRDDGSGVESRVHAHERHAGRRVAGQDGGCHRCGTPMPWQERRMEVDGAVPRQIEDRGRDEPPVVGEHDEVGGQPPKILDHVRVAQRCRHHDGDAKLPRPGAPPGWAAARRDDRPVSAVR